MKAAIFKEIEHIEVEDIAETRLRRGWDAGECESLRTVRRRYSELSQWSQGGVSTRLWGMKSPELLRKSAHR